MANLRTITYAIDLDTNLVISRVYSEVMIPILDFDGMTSKNNFETNYNLEKMSVQELRYNWSSYKWTKKIPKEIKNLHRLAWGMKELK